MRTVLARPYGSKKGLALDGSLNSIGGGMGGGGGGGMCLLFSIDDLRNRSCSENGDEDTLFLKLDFLADF